MDFNSTLTAGEPMLSFTSDNIAGASPEVLEAILRCNSGQAIPYGADDLSAKIERQLCEIFERDVRVFLVPTGTAANSLCLSTMTPPWGNIFCHPSSHIQNDECGAPEFFTYGAKLVNVDGASAKIDVEKLRLASRVKVGDVHSTQPACVSLTQATEMGSVYSVAEIGAIGEICKAQSLRLHMDGARFANAMVSLNCSPADMTWRAGVDALSFGATKNGVLAAEAIVLFDTSLVAAMSFRRKRAGHLFSKMRFLAAQMDAYLRDDLWVRNAHQANNMAQHLVLGLNSINGVEVIGEPQSNIVFCRIPKALVDGLLKAGFSFLHDRWAPGIVRLVTSFETRKEDVDRFIRTLYQIAGQRATNGLTEGAAV